MSNSFLLDCQESLTNAQDKGRENNCDCIGNLEYILNNYTDETLHFWIQKYRTLNRFRYHSIVCSHVWTEMRINVEFPIAEEEIVRWRNANPTLPQQIANINEELRNWCLNNRY